ncbi:MAG: hypothetical protein JRJ85_13880, partial [Deltaproteobacteria bacterium]|nr:hypothetical protein [Deltaproteobacteria bacterium]
SNDSISSFNPTAFVEDVNKFIKGECKKKKNVKINRSRFEILSPLVALDLLTQASNQKDTVNVNYHDLKNEIGSAISAIEEGSQIREIGFEYLNAKEDDWVGLLQQNIRYGDDILEGLRKILDVINIEDTQEARKVLKGCVNGSEDLKDCIMDNSLTILFPEYNDMISKAKKNKKIDHQTLKTFAEKLERMIDEIQAE